MEIDAMSSSGQSHTNSQNVALSREQMQFEERMSDTAVQRRVADLKQAGMNPLLAAGSAASVPSYTLPNVQNPDAAYQNVGSQAASAVGVYQQKQLQDA